MLRFLLLSFSLTCLLSTCAQRHCSTALPDAYDASIKQWQNQQRASLNDPQGWLSLVGLYWLKPGDNRCGSGDDMDIPLPAGLPSWATTYTLRNGTVYCTPSTQGAVKVLDTDACRMRSGSYIWEVIERGGRHGIRLRDTLRPARIRLRPRAYFPIQPAYRVCARVQALTDKDSIRLKNILAMEYALPLAGKIHFQLQGNTYELLALDGGPDHLFIAISDETTSESTYGGGRYLDCPRPDAKGQTILDFNQLYNPPCVFTDYATCLLPPAENHLPFAVTAGEKTYGDH